MKGTLFGSNLGSRYDRSFPFFYRNILSGYYSYSYREKFQAIDTFVAFLGYPRSGHSIIGALLDAHPEVTISHELHALRWMQEGISRDELFGMILAKSNYFFKRGTRWSGYSYRVDNQYQNNFESLKVIGDKKGGGTTNMLVKNRSALDLFDSLGCRVKLIHVMRNPFDNVISRAQGGNLKKKEVTRERLDKAIESHVGHVNAVKEAQSLNRYDMIDVKMEDFSNHPAETLNRLLDFIGVSNVGTYLDDCSAIVRKSSKRKRDAITWLQEDIDRIDRLIQDTAFMKGYSFDSE